MSVLSMCDISSLRIPVAHTRAKNQLKKAKEDYTILCDCNSFVPQLLKQYAKSMPDFVDHVHRPLRVTGAKVDVSGTNAGFGNV